MDDLELLLSFLVLGIGVVCAIAIWIVLPLGQRSTDAGFHRSKTKPRPFYGENFERDVL